MAIDGDKQWNTYFHVHKCSNTTSIVCATPEEIDEFISTLVI